MAELTRRERAAACLDRHKIPPPTPAMAAQLARILATATYTPPSSDNTTEGAER